MVGLEQTSLTVSENVGMVEICTVIFFPDDPCPTEFPFELMIVTVSGTAGSINCLPFITRQTH